MAEKSNLNIEEKFAQLQNAKQVRPQISRPKIQRVANYLRNRKHFAKHYSPKLMSIGPIHHRDPNLKLGEQYKLMWAAMYIESTGKSPQILHKKIADNIEELKSLFAKDLLTDHTLFPIFPFSNEGVEEMLAWMLFVDGCCLLQILEKAKLDKPEKMNVKVDQLVLVMQDVLLLENQIPYQVLKLLWRCNEFTLLETMRNFLRCHHWAERNGSDHHAIRNAVVVFLEDPPTHLLDLQRRIILPDHHAPPKTQCNEANEEEQNQNNPNENHDKANQEKQNQNDSNENSDMVTYRNIQELKEAGIRLKSSKTRRPRDVSFSHGWLAAELTLPEIVVDDTTPATFLNLVAYEMCPDFENDYGICSFVAFMDSLIDHPEDVKALRSEGILLNSLGSDEEVAKLFNMISTDLVPDSVAYADVRAQIDKHYRNKWKTCVAVGYHTYFNNPWAIIAFLAAVLALVLTFVQTWFAIYPAGC
ncbi:hypothetical protein SESBI_44543 [Sesbania bispinosa]|nr:hypothetical protein SESBI_44543 [Sesbania bispinosa]